MDNPETSHDVYAEHRHRYAEILAKYTPPELLQRTGTVRVLSVGGADGLECQALMDAAENINPKLNIYFEALDLDEAGMRESSRMNPKIPVQNFKVGDATNIQNFGPDSWDLIIIRNPNLRDIRLALTALGGVSDNWKNIFKNSVQKLKAGGYLFITDYSTQEQDLVLGELNSRQDFPELQLLLQDSTEEPSLSRSGTGFILDRTVTIFKKN